MMTCKPGNHKDHDNRNITCFKQNLKSKTQSVKL